MSLLPAQHRQMESLVNYRVSNKLQPYPQAVNEVAARLEWEYRMPAEDIASSFFSQSNPDRWKNAERRAYAKFRLTKVDCHKGVE